MPTRNVNLTDQFDDFIADEIAAGRYHNASEVMRAGLRLLQEQTSADAHKLEMLRRLATEGLTQLQQGRGIEFTSSSDLARHIGSLGASRPKPTARRRA
jgi:antitoxin ParD1/3/4